MPGSANTDEVKALKEEFGELKAMFAKFMEMNKSENT